MKMAEENPGFLPPPDEIQTSCQERLPLEAIEGLNAFNSGQFFEAHEHLETAWRDEQRPVRELYRGVLQVAVGYYHISRENYTGARKMFARSRRWLSPFPAVCGGINLQHLRQDMDRVEAELVRLGPDHIADFDHSLFKLVEFLHN
jgi:predicted metal-dependent hydrolase